MKSEISPGSAGSGSRATGMELGDGLEAGVRSGEHERVVVRRPRLQKTGLGAEAIVGFAVLGLLGVVRLEAIGTRLEASAGEHDVPLIDPRGGSVVLGQVLGAGRDKEGDRARCRDGEQRNAGELPGLARNERDGYERQGNEKAESCQPLSGPRLAFAPRHDRGEGQGREQRGPDRDQEQPRLWGG
jgi:hypothetical protein